MWGALRGGGAVICHPDRRLDGLCRAGAEGSLFDSATSRTALRTVRGRVRVVGCVARGVRSYLSSRPQARRSLSSRSGGIPLQFRHKPHRPAYGAGASAVVGCVAQGCAVICHPDRRLDGLCRAGAEGSLFNSATSRTALRTARGPSPVVGCVAQGCAVICHPDRRLDGLCRAGAEGSLLDSATSRTALRTARGRVRLWGVLRGGAQLFVIPTAGSTVFVEPERRDLSSIPPQAAPPCVRCGGECGLWGALRRGAQLFVIPTAGSTVFVEPERRDPSSIPPQATRCSHTRCCDVALPGAPTSALKGRDSDFPIPPNHTQRPGPHARRVTSAAPSASEKQLCRTNSSAPG